MVKKTNQKNWIEYKLSNLCDVRKFEKMDSILYVGLENIGQGNNQLIGRGDINDFSSNKNTFCKNDVLYGKLRPNLNKVWLATEDGYCSTDILPLKINEKTIPKIILSVLSGKKFVNHAMSSSSGTKMPRTKWKEIKSFTISLPEINEQKKITEILFDVDQLIDHLFNLIIKKKNIKQGVMQEFLTGKKRLDGFCDEWEEKELQKIITEIKNGQLITEKTSIAGNIPVIGGGKTSSYSHHKPNRFHKTITISASGANAGYVSFHDYPIFASDCSTIEEGEDYSIEFIYYQLKRLQLQIYHSQTGGNQPHIHAKELYPLKIPVPKTKKEQTMVSEVFLDMDSEIKELDNQLKKYQNIKQGIMQKLLTGEIRIK
jgi:type I restriction enzyme, S subunit